MLFKILIIILFSLIGFFDTLLKTHIAAQKVELRELCNYNTKMIILKREKTPIIYNFD